MEYEKRTDEKSDIVCVEGQPETSSCVFFLKKLLSLNLLLKMQHKVVVKKFTQCLFIWTYAYKTLLYGFVLIF